MRYINNKRTKAVLLATVFCITYLLTYISYIQPMTVYAATTGTVNDTPVNVRSTPDTSTTTNKITQLSAGDQVTILGTVNPTDTYAWYNISFDYNGVNTTGYIAAEFVSVNANYNEDTDFETYMNVQGFPESYKDGLRQMHAQYPKWVFRAEYVGRDWNTALSAESEIGKSLISGWSIDSWKSMEPGAYDYSNGTWISFDSGYWVAASKALVAYAMDPRNFLNSTNIFMFEDLAYNPSLQTVGGLNSITSGTFMQNMGTIGEGIGMEFAGIIYSTYADALIKAAQMSGVNPYHLASRIIQEMGSNGLSDSISGTTSAYPGFYNYYNWNAYATDGLSAIVNGLKYATVDDYPATLRPWNTRMRSIIGGAMKLGTDYITKGQNILYYQKFNVVSAPLYSHQYMTNVLASRSESISASQAYSDSMKASTPLVFKIPVYQNMPSGICEVPTGTKSSNNYLSSLNVSNTRITPTFDYTITNYDVIVENGVSDITVNAEPKASSASVSGIQTYGLNVGTNTINVVVTADNGSTRTYTINVVRKPGSGADIVSSGTYTVNQASNTIFGAGVGSNATDVVNGISVTSSYSKRLVNADGSDNSGKIATGDRLIVTDGSGQEVSSFTFVIYGDVNGDGAITMLDIIYVKRHILGISSLEGAYATAADAKKGGSSITMLDLIYMKRDILDIAKIVQ